MRWAILDVILVIVFAVIGRLSHGEGLGLGGVLGTLWPFLTGLLIGWLLVRGLNRPGGGLIAGVVIWPATVAVGMLLRALTGQGTATAFVIVATVFLGVFLLGPRIWASRRVEA